MTKYIGVSKLRLMAGGSKFCCVCGTLLGGAWKKSANWQEGRRSNHLCPEHLDWHLHVTDSSTMPDPDHRIGDRWEEVDTPGSNAP